MEPYSDADNFDAIQDTRAEHLSLTGEHLPHQAFYTQRDLVLASLMVEHNPDVFLLRRTRKPAPASSSAGAPVPNGPQPLSSAQAADLRDRHFPEAA
jgi:hypothetical protein